MCVVLILGAGDSEGWHDHGDTRRSCSPACKIHVLSLGHMRSLEFRVQGFN